MQICTSRVVLRSRIILKRGKTRLFPGHAFQGNCVQSPLISLLLCKVEAREEQLLHSPKMAGEAGQVE